MKYLFRVRLMHRCGYPLADLVVDDVPTMDHPGWAEAKPVGKVEQIYADTWETYTWRCKCGATIQMRDERVQEIWRDYVLRHADETPHRVVVTD